MHEFNHISFVCLDKKKCDERERCELSVVVFFFLFDALNSTSIQKREQTINDVTTVLYFVFFFEEVWF